jgi:hypothetical protein
VVARHGGEPWHLVSYSSSSKAVHTQLAGVHATASGDVWAVGQDRDPASCTSTGRCRTARDRGTYSPERRHSPPRRSGVGRRRVQRHWRHRLHDPAGHEYGGRPLRCACCSPPPGSLRSSTRSTSRRSLRRSPSRALTTQPVARGLRILAFALRSYESIDDPWGHLPVPAGAWRDRCRRIVVPDRHHRRGSARCVSERDPGRRRGSSKATASRALLPCPTSNQANVADLMAAVRGLAVRPGRG